MITATQAKYAGHLAEIMARVRTGGKNRLRGTKIPVESMVAESCVCVVALMEDDCSPETVAEVFDALDLFNKPEGIEGLMK